MSTAEQTAHEHEHPKFLAHHFDTPQQQFDSGKLGIWLFLTTEILLFSGLFCAYAVYRANHPEIFMFAHKYLDTNLGAINTVVLLFSSLTMAWAVRAAQLGQKKLLVNLLAITLLCGFGFLGIKTIEYKDKISHGTLWGTAFNPHYKPGDKAGAHASDGEHAPAPAPSETPAVAPAPAPAVTEVPTTNRAVSGNVYERTKFAPAAVGTSAVSPTWAAAQEAGKPYSPGHAEHGTGPAPANVHIFFGIYFVMTGLHGLHVIAGMACIGWILLRSIKGEFGPEYFNPVDFVGLYWHLVDLVWIFLFPLLYLIH